jgi:hypothetical protein
MLEEALLTGRITIEVYDRLMQDLLKRSVEDTERVNKKDLQALHAETLVLFEQVLAEKAYAQWDEEFSEALSASSL